MFTYLSATLIGVCSLVGYKAIKLYNDCYLFKDTSTKRVYQSVTRFHECIREIINLLTSKPKAYRVLGMDCEMTSPSIGFPDPALLQLARPDGYCVFFHLKKMGPELFLPSKSGYAISPASSLTLLRQVLEDSTILKVGVNVLEDARYLEHQYGLVTKGCLDVRHMARVLKIKPAGLDELGKTVIGRGKVKVVSKRPWESNVFELTESQLDYAAEDARLGVDIFLELNKRYINSKYSWIKRIFWNEEMYWRHTIRKWQKYVGEQFKLKKEGHTNVDPKWKKNLPVTKGSRYIRKSIIEGESASTNNPRFLFEAQIRFTCYNCRQYRNIPSKVSVIPHSVLHKDEPHRVSIVPVEYDIERTDIQLCQRCYNEFLKDNKRIREELVDMCGAPYPDYQDSNLLMAKKLARRLLYNTDFSSDQCELNEFRFCEMLGITRKQLGVEVLELVLSLDCWPGSLHAQFVCNYFEELDPAGLKGLRQFWYAKRRRYY